MCFVQVESNFISTALRSKSALFAAIDDLHVDPEYAFVRIFMKDVGGVFARHVSSLEKVEDLASICNIVGEECLTQILKTAKKDWSDHDDEESPSNNSIFIMIYKDRVVYRFDPMDSTRNPLSIPSIVRWTFDQSHLWP